MGVCRMNPQFPVYIVSKGRWETRLTSKSLEYLKVPYFIVVEEQEYSKYKEVIDEKKILILDKKFQRDYETFDDLGDTKSKGPGAARNFAWEHSISLGAKWHWVMDDNIRHFFRLNDNLRIRVSDGTIFKCMEDFVLRYQNVAMAGPNYSMFAPRKQKKTVFTVNTRIYSCNLIRNDVPFRWRGRYNEDTDLSLRMLKAKWCTVQFNAFLQGKVATQTMTGGNSDDFYRKEGTTAKSIMLAKMHPDISKVKMRFNRVHHWVDYSVFKNQLLVLKPGVKIEQKVDNYGLALKVINPT